MAGNSYIKSVEEYFLNHARKGIMLSSVDYELINKWKTRNIPLELVLSGIREAFSENRNNDYYFIRSLKSISDFVENKINLELSVNFNTEKSIRPYSDQIIIYFDRINRDIERCNNSRVKNCLINLKDKIKSSNSRDLSNEFDTISLENELMEDIYNSLNAVEKRILDNQVEILLQNYSDKCTEKALKKSYYSHRNNILKKKYNISFMD